MPYKSHSPLWFRIEALPLPLCTSAEGRIINLRDEELVVRNYLPLHPNISTRISVVLCHNQHNEIWVVEPSNGEDIYGDMTTTFGV